MAGALCLTAARIRQLICGNSRIALKQLVRCPLKTHEARRINAVSQIQADWSDGSLIADAKAYRMDHVGEILEIALAHAKGNASQILEDIPRIMKDDTVYVVAQKGESKFEGVEKGSVPS